MADDALSTRINLTPIGVIRTPFTTLEGMPIQAVAAEGVYGRVELTPGLRDNRGAASIGWFARTIHHTAQARSSQQPGRLSSMDVINE